MQAAKLESFEITRDELLPGDIIIVTDTRKNTHSFNKLTRITQSTQLLFAQGHSAAVHAQIIARDDAGQLTIVEVSDDGVLLADIKERYRYNMFVYRPNNRVLAEQAGNVAYAGYKEYRQVKETSQLEEAPDTTQTEQEVKSKSLPDSLDKTSDNRKEITYSDGGLVHAIAFPVLLFPYHFTSTHFTLKTFCSKFVIQCFQIAQHQLIQETPQLKRDIKRLFKKEKTSSVKSLEHYVKKHKDFTPFIIPKEQETIYPVLVKNILVDAITQQKSDSKSAQGAKKAWEIHQRLTTYVDQEGLLKNPNYKPFDLAIAIYFATLAHLPSHKVIEDKAFEFGYEREILKDNRIMTLAHTLLERAKHISPKAAPNRDIVIDDANSKSNSDSEDYAVFKY